MLAGRNDELGQKKGRLSDGSEAFWRLERKLKRNGTWKATYRRHNLQLCLLRLPDAGSLAILHPGS